MSIAQTCKCSCTLARVSNGSAGCAQKCTHTHTRNRRRQKTTTSAAIPFRYARDVLFNKVPRYLHVSLSNHHKRPYVHIQTLKLGNIQSYFLWLSRRASVTLLFGYRWLSQRIQTRNVQPWKQQFQRSSGQNCRQRTAFVPFFIFNNRGQIPIITLCNLPIASTT